MIPGNIRLLFQFFSSRMGRRAGHLKKHSFKPGESPTRHKHSGWDVYTKERGHIVRVNKDEAEFISTNTVEDVQEVMMDAGRQAASSAKVTDYVCLRPRPTPDFFDTCSEKGQTELLIIHKEKTLALFNNSYKDHNQMSPSCEGSFTWHDEEQRGLAWIMSLKCTSCQYKSPKTKLYDEVEEGKRGRKTAVQNKAIHLGLARNGISYTGLIDILASANIPPPAHSTLQRKANQVNPVLVKSNEADMKATRVELGELMEKCGKKNKISAEGDGTYNNRWASSQGSTPMQAGTQATYILCENNSPSKKIIAAKTVNRLCSCRLGTSVMGPHKQGCTANIPYSQAIGSESLFLEECIRQVNSDGISIEDLTVDGDGSARKAATSILQPDGSDIELQYCTRHLSRLVQKKLYAKKFSNQMYMKSGRTVTHKAEIHRLLSYDIPKRLAAEFNAAHNKYGSDKRQLIRHCSYLYDAVIKCYSGDCSLCHKYSLVCAATKPWPRPYFRRLSIYKNKKLLISPSNKDVEGLREILAFRLSPNAVNMTYKNKTQNKSEGVNRGIIKSNPKHLTHSRNYHGRTHAAIHSMNNGPGKSLSILLNILGCPISSKSKTIKALRGMDRRKRIMRQYMLSQRAKDARAWRRDLNYKIWDNQKQEKNTYKKCADIYEAMTAPADHGYSRRRIVRCPAARKLH